jgi:chromosome segregation ATPase
MKMDKKVQSLR